MPDGNHRQLVDSARFRNAFARMRVHDADRQRVFFCIEGDTQRVLFLNGHVADARIGITAVNPAPMLVKGAGEMLSGKEVDDGLAGAVGDLAAKMAKPLTTSALTPEYRREMIRVFTKRAVLAASN